MTMTMKGDRIQMSIIKIYIDKDLCINWGFPTVKIKIQPKKKKKEGISTRFNLKRILQKKNKELKVFLFRGLCFCSSSVRLHE